MLTFVPSNGSSPAVVTAQGPVSLTEVKNILRDLAHQARNCGLVWDMRKAELGAWHSRDMKDVAETIVSVMPGDHSYRVAIIGCGTLHYGLYRVFQINAEFAGLKREYEFFVDPAEARAWLGAHLDGPTSNLPWMMPNLTGLPA